MPQRTTRITAIATGSQIVSATSEVRYPLVTISLASRNVKGISDYLEEVTLSAAEARAVAEHLLSIVLPILEGRDTDQTGGK